MFRASDDLRC